MAFPTLVKPCRTPATAFLTSANSFATLGKVLADPGKNLTNRGKGVAGGVFLGSLVMETPLKALLKLRNTSIYYSYIFILSYLF